ncbi:MAG: hypothetical protein WCF85_20290, partial [Rhodospirillaceae bacterium]
MTHDPSDAGIPPGQAIFLPAFQLPVIGDIADPEGRPIFPSAQDLNWFRPDNPHWSYCAGLYSLGQSNLVGDGHEENMILQRDRNATLLIADSGGYQLGKNTFKRVAGKMSAEFLRSQEYDQIRMEMLAWMEAHADYGLIIDFPAWAIGEKGFIFTRFDDCLSETVRNAEFFRDHITGENTLRLLTVVQGRSIYEALAWYNRIKTIEAFPYAGWSFAGPVAYDPTIALRMILTLLREGRLSRDENWLHFLGQGSPAAIFVYNVIQQCLDEYIGQNIRLSYDISSPFLLAKYGKVYTHMAATKKGYSVQEEKFTRNIKNFSTVYRKKWCKWLGPFDDDIDYNDLVVTGTKHGVDTRSYSVLAHRNLNIYWQAMKSIVLSTELLADPKNRGSSVEIHSTLTRFGSCK